MNLELKSFWGTLTTGRVVRELTRGRSTVLLHVLVGALIFGAALVLVGWRINLTPDIFTDEIQYARLGVRIQGEGALVWDSGRPMMVHPPLYFLAEAGYYALSGADFPLYEPGDIFATITHARFLNVFLAALTAVLMYGVGVRLFGLKMGLLLVALFLLDPFAIRINRRAMLETMAGLLALSGMAVLLFNAGTGRRAYGAAIFAGLLFGAGLLTKEIIFTAPLAVAGFGVWELLRRVDKTGFRLEAAWAAPLLAGALAFVTYLIFPLWAFWSGNWDEFAREKIFSLQRLMGLIHVSGWNRPGVSAYTFLVRRLGDYGSSYILLMLGAFAWLALLAWQRDRRSARLLIAWGAVIYPFYAFLTFFGSGNDQFFYFLLVAAIVFVVYALLGETQPVSPGTAALMDVPVWRTWLARSESLWNRLRRYALLALLFVILPYNLANWWISVATRVDNGYARLSTYIETNLPPGVPINASGDAKKFDYFLPGHPITDASTPTEAQEQGVKYFVIAPKDVEARYGRITLELAGWIAQNGTRLHTVQGDSYGVIHLYRLGQTQEPASFERRYPPAETGYLYLFVWLTIAWTVVWGAVALWFVRAGRQPGKQSLRAGGARKQR